MLAIPQDAAGEDELVCYDRTDARKGLVAVSAIAVATAAIAGLVVGGLPDAGPAECPGSSRPWPPLACND